MPEALRAVCAGAALLALSSAAGALRVAPGERDLLLPLLALCGLGLAPRPAIGLCAPALTRLRCMSPLGPESLLAPLLLVLAGGLLPLPPALGAASCGAAAAWAGAAAGGALGARDPLRVALAAAAGASASLGLLALLPDRPMAALPLLIVAAGAGWLMRAPGEAERGLRAGHPGRRWLATLLCAAPALRCGLALPLGALGLAVVGPRPWSRSGAALGLGVLLGLGLARLLPRRLGVWAAAEALGLGALLALARRAPLGGAGELLGLLLVSGLCAGAGLGGPLRAGGARGLLVVGLSPLLWASLTGWAASTWTPVERLSLALGGTQDPSLRAAVREERALLRWERLGPPSTHVVELAGAGKAVRLLLVDGRLVGAVPARHGEGEQLLAAPTLLGALAGGLAPGEAALLGLSTGVAAEAARLMAPQGVTVVEPVDGLRALLDDPGQPFGLANGHLQPATPGLRLVDRGLRAWLLGADGRPAALAAPDPDPALVALAAGRGPVGFMLAAEQGVAAADSAGGPRLAPLAVRVAERLSGDEPAWAFAPAGPEGELVLLRGVPRLDAAALLRRAETAAVASALGRAGLAPIDLLATCVADPDATRQALEERPERLMGALLRAGAAGDGPRLDLPADPEQAAGLLLDLAEAAGRRRLPAALPWVRRALELRRSARALTAWGDLLYRDRREEEALAAWEEALRLEPRALAARISIATHRRNRQDLAGAQEVLRAGLSGDPARDAPLHYLLGEVFEVEGDDAAAAAAFRAAGEHRDAPTRAVEAARRARGAQSRPLSPRDRLQAARELLDRRRGAPPREAEARRLEALELVLPLATQPDLGADERRQAARLLERLAEDEPLAPLRQNVHRRAAELLAPLPAPRDVLERARALVRSGDPSGAEALLRPLLGQPSLEQPLLARGHLVLGEVLRAEGRLDEAVSAWERGLALSPPTSADAWALEAIAEAEQERGQRDRALTALQRAEELVPGLPRVRLARARLLEAMQRPGDALEAWRGFLAVAGPADPARQEAAQRIAELEARRTPR